MKIRIFVGTFFFVFSRAHVAARSELAQNTLPLKSISSLLLFSATYRRYARAARKVKCFFCGVQRTDWTLIAPAF